VSFWVEEATTFRIDDEFTFTTSADSWNVVGGSSGYMASARTDVPYVSNDNEIAFTINSGSDTYQYGDRSTFDTIISGDWQVTGTVSDTQLLRAKSDVPYVSDNNEVSFTIKSGSFPFVTDDSFSFNVTESGLGAGKIVHDIVKASGNSEAAVLYAATPTGVFKSVNGGGTWAETGSFTGDYLSTLAVHTDQNNVIYAGTMDAGVWISIDNGAIWNQYIDGTTTKERHVEDLLVDAGNSKLYAITYCWGAEELHAVGNVYVHGLNADGSISTGAWVEANIGLPEFSDEIPTLLAQHVMAPNIAGSPATLYIGGEGISLSKASSGLMTGEPVWQSSQNGLTNLIMARMPILFTGPCTIR